MFLKDKISQPALAFVLCAAVFYAAAPVLPASADPAQEARTAVQAAYAAMDRATARRDAAAYAVFLAPEFVGLDQNGTNTGGRAETLKELKQALAQVSAAKSATQILTLTLQDGGAVVTTRAGLVLSGTKNRRPFVIQSKSRVRDFWAKSAGRWRLKRERVLSMSQTVHGLSAPSAP